MRGAGVNAVDRAVGLRVSGSGCQHTKPHAARAAATLPLPAGDIWRSTGFRPFQVDLSARTQQSARVDALQTCGPQIGGIGRIQQDEIEGCQLVQYVWRTCLQHLTAIRQAQSGQFRAQTGSGVRIGLHQHDLRGALRGGFQTQHAAAGEQVQHARAWQAGP